MCVCLGGGGGLVYAVRVFQCLLLKYLQLQSFHSRALGKKH